MLRTFVALVAALALSACVSSTNPAGPESAAIAEKGLVGSWRYAGDSDDVFEFVHVLELADNRVQVVAVNEFRNDWAVLLGYVTQAGPRRILNLRMVSTSDRLRGQLDKDGRPNFPYSFVAYRLEGKDRLVVSQPIRAIQSALEKGKLAGESASGGLFVSDQTEKIAAVLGSASDADVFTKVTVYKRIEAR